MRLFFFGTLLDPELFEIVVGRPLDRVAHAPARLDGWTRRRVAEEDYPVLVADPRGAAPGRLVAGLSWGEIDRCLFYEGDEYALRPVPVAVDPADAAVVHAAVARAGAPPEGAPDRPDRVTAHAYLSNGLLTDTAEPWRFEIWQAEVKLEALAIARAWMALYGRLTVAEAEERWERIRDAARPAARPALV
jgi:hypothetical protein